MSVGSDQPQRSSGLALVPSLVRRGPMVVRLGRDSGYGSGSLVAGTLPHEMRDPYRVLSVRRDATRPEIHRSFRALARELHPDRGGDPALMQAINDAWAILGRPSHRRAYDEARAAAIRRARARQAAKREPGSPATTVGATGDVATGVAPSPRRRERRPDTLDYGRYEGWTIGELARVDPDYLLWLARTQAGRIYRGKIMQVLAEREARE